MPTIVTTDYFKSGELFIPNSFIVPDIQDGAVSAQDELQSFIDKYEKLLLVGVLGIEQYNLLIANQEQTSGKWFDLINGKKYENKVWAGLRPLIASFVYCKYLENDKSYYTTVGIERSKAKNSVSVNPTLKLTEVWNSFVEMYQGAFDCDWRYLQPIFYFEGWDLGNYRNSTYASLIDYLRAFPDDYSTDYFLGYEVKNRFGL